EGASMTFDEHIQTIKYVLPKTIPIMAGFTYIGLGFGIYLYYLGFGSAYAFLMSIFLYASSMDFVTSSILIGSFNRVNEFLRIIMINARHLFYGIAMLEKFKETGKKKFYLIYGMCDETFVINSTEKVPKHINSGWFMFYVTV